MKIASRWVAVAALVGCAGFAQAGPDWVEGELRAERGLDLGDTGGNDAGSFLTSAQTTTGSGSLDFLEGRLSNGGALLDDSPDYVDMYRIAVATPGSFSVTVNSSPFSVALYLFRIVDGQAVGMLGSQTGFLSSSSTDGSEIEVTEPGVYALAVTYSGNVPTSDGEGIFDFGGGLSALQGATSSIGDTIGADNDGPHDGWTGEPPEDLGDYILSFQGASLVPGVGPLSGALAMLGMGAIATGRRRRI
jgi:hypothetical protein